MFTFRLCSNNNVHKIVNKFTPQVISYFVMIYVTFISVTLTANTVSVQELLLVLVYIIIS